MIAGAGDARAIASNLRRCSLALPFELATSALARAGSGDGAGRFEGLAATFNRPDRANDILLPGAFGSIDATLVRMLWQHRADQPIGVWDEIRETPEGLRVAGRLLLDVQQGREAYALLKAGAVDALSIGFSVPAGGALLDRKTGQRRLREVDLWEISLVTFPANEFARVARVKAQPARPEPATLAPVLRRLAQAIAPAR
jgi:HK97 family phage prohead protease